MALVARLTDPGGWDWGTAPDWVVAVTAIVSALLVVRQLASLGDDRRQAEAARTTQLERFGSEAATARANLLLRIDEQFEGDAVFRSRARWLELRARSLREHAALAAPPLPRDDFVARAITAELDALWDRLQNHADPATFAADLSDYNLIVRLPNWIETIGMIAHERLVPLADVIRLYGGLVRMTMTPIDGHMAHRRLVYPASTAFANALWLHAAVLAA